MISSRGKLTCAKNASIRSTVGGITNPDLVGCNLHEANIPLASLVCAGVATLDATIPDKPPDHFVGDSLGGSGDFLWGHAV